MRKSDLDGPNHAWRGLAPNVGYGIVALVMLCLMICQMAVA
jgi:hypothetical protein